MMKHGSEQSTYGAIDELFSRIDRKLRAGDFATVDSELQTLDIERLSTVMLIAWLSITLVAKDRLPSRAHLVERVRRKLECTEPERVERLLVGLQ